jgi:hypothetical protein
MGKKHPASKLYVRSGSIGPKAFAAISAVEGLKLTSAGRKRVLGSAPIEQRRAEVLKVYMDLKGSK